MGITSYIYTFIREDLSPEQKIVQIGHACYEAGKKFGNEDIPNLVLLSVKDEKDLKSIFRKLDSRGIEFCVFFEPDISSFTAICTRPITDEKERSIFSKWDLYKHTIDKIEEIL